MLLERVCCGRSKEAAGCVFNVFGSSHVSQAGCSLGVNVLVVSFIQKGELCAYLSTV